LSAITGTGAAPVVRRKRLPLPAPAKLLFLAVVAAALAAAVAALSQIGLDTPRWPTFVLLSAAASAAHLFVVRTGRNTGFHTGIVFITAAALLLPPELVALMGLAPFVPEWMKERYPWYIGAFNIANFTLGALAAWSAAHLVGGTTTGAHELRFAVAGLAAAVTFVFLNHFLLASMLRLGRGHTFRESELFSVKSLGPELVLATLGVALTTLWIANPWILPAVVAPLVWSHRSFATLAMLRESEARFRAMFELAPVGSRLMDLERRTVGTNQAFQRMLGYTADELEGMPPTAFSAPEDEEVDRELFAELVEGRREHYELERRYRAKDGRTVWGHLAVSLVRDADGRPKFGIGMVEDTTERKLAEESLRASEERYRELFENANDMVFTLDLDGRFTAINRAGERITGLPREELLGRRMGDLLAERPDVATPGADTVAYECELIADDGRRVALEVASRVIRSGDDPIGVQGIARDVSERRALEEQLRQAQKMEAVGQLAGGVAHDFNNLLTAITGYSEFALGRLDDGSEKVRSNINEIKKAAERASALTRQLLAFSRKQILQPKLIRPDELVAGLDDLLRRLIGKHIEILTVSRPGLGFVRVDPGQLEQVVVNLAVNARDAMPDGGRLTIETANVDLDELDARAHEGALPGPYVTVAVQDTGDGIDAAALPRIFEPFFTTKEQGKGTGLGLATVYGIVQQSGGFLAVDSDTGAGSSFRVYLPRLDGEAPAAAVEAEADATLAEGSETVLLVEDEAIVRDLLREILETTGYRVLEAVDGVDALALADAHTEAIDLLLTDVVMPKMSGRDLAERFREVRPDTKVLYTSGYTDGAIAEHGVLAPGTEFLQKPFSFAELTQKVRSVLDAAAA
jgi:two-component system cell cycle sensor histidine kinase/response regulator CckA